MGPWDEQSLVNRTSNAAEHSEPADLVFPVPVKANGRHRGKRTPAPLVVIHGPFLLVNDLSLLGICVVALSSTLKHSRRF